jgi:hypothetical protein
MQIAHITLLHHRDPDGRLWLVPAVEGAWAHREPSVRLSVSCLPEIGDSRTCSALTERRSKYENHGQRVVVGQRLMQSASDIFLGWTRGRRGRDFFIRQLRDRSMSHHIEEGVSAQQTMLYAELCGRTLAHAHAKSGDAALISGYLGKSDDFDLAIGEFALAYADQNEQDHAALVAAVKAGKIEAIIEAN